MIKNYVTFLSPGTFFHEETTEEVDTWDVEKAVERAKCIKERHGATPFAFQFKRRERAGDEFDSKETERSGLYFLGGDVLTLADVEARNDPKDETLIANMKGNNIDRVVVNGNSWKSTNPLGKNDTVLEFVV